MVLSTANEIIQKEALDKGFATAGDPLALEICRTVVCSILENEDGITGWGYAGCSGGLGELHEHLTGVIKLVKRVLTAEQIVGHKSWIKEFATEMQKYGYGHEDLVDADAVFQS